MNEEQDGQRLSRAAELKTMATALLPLLGTTLLITAVVGGILASVVAHTTPTGDQQGPAVIQQYVLVPAPYSPTAVTWMLTTFLPGAQDAGLEAFTFSVCALAGAALLTVYTVMRRHRRASGDQAGGVSLPGYFFPASAVGMLPFGLAVASVSFGLPGGYELSTGAIFAAVLMALVCAIWSLTRITRKPAPARGTFQGIHDEHS